MFYQHREVNTISWDFSFQQFSVFFSKALHFRWPFEIQWEKFGFFICWGHFERVCSNNVISLPWTYWPNFHLLFWLWKNCIFSLPFIFAIFTITEGSVLGGESGPRGRAGRGGAYFCLKFGESLIRKNLSPIITRLAFMIKFAKTQNLNFDAFPAVSKAFYS